MVNRRRPFERSSLALARSSPFLVVAAAALALAAGAACASVVGVEVTRAPSEDNDIDGAPRTDQPNSATVASPDADPVALPDAGEGIACGCDAGGQVCCVGSGAGSTAASCIATEGVCTGLRLRCRRSSENGRDCCWNDGGAFAQTTYGTCSDRVACLEENDCKAHGGGTCATTVCNGVTIGVCLDATTTTTSAPTCP